MANKTQEVNRDQKVTLECDCQVNGKHVKKGESVQLTAGEKAVFESHSWIKKEGE